MVLRTLLGKEFHLERESRSQGSDHQEKHTKKVFRLRLRRYFGHPPFRRLDDHCRATTEEFDRERMGIAAKE